MLLVSLIIILTSCIPDIPEKMYNLNITTDGNGSYSVEPDKDLYQHGESVTITAIPNEDYSFSHWSGDVESTDNPLNITITKNTNIKANYKLKSSYSLNITTDGNGSYSVEPDKDLYQHGESVTITAIPNEDYSFSHWSGDVESTDNPLNITITKNTNIKANYKLKSSYSLNITTDGNGSYSVEPDKDLYQHGESVTITAIPNEDYRFINWEINGIDHSNDVKIEIIMNEDKNVKAFFKEFNKIEVPYTATDGLIVTLHNLEVIEKSGSYRYKIEYTLRNDTDHAINEGTFKLYHAEGGLAQYGFFGKLFPGDSLTRTYYFEEEKNVNFNILAYHHDQFLEDSPPYDSLMWKVNY